MVCSELLFHKFDASIMSVDTGIDIAVVKDNRFFGIQVKTSQPRKKTKFSTNYSWTISRSSMEKHNKSNIFYIFVLIDGLKKDCLILPLTEMEKRIDQGIIKVVNQNSDKYKSSYSIAVKFKNDKYYLGRGTTHENEMTYFLNNWDIIK